MGKIVVLASLLMLSGCNMGQRDANNCQTYGFTPGTDAFAQCMQNAAMQRQAAISQFMAIQQQQAAQQQQNYQQQMQAIQNQQRANQPTNCTTSYVGNQAYTHCY